MNQRHFIPAFAGGRGITLLEVLLSIFLFSLIMISAVFVFKNSVIGMQKQDSEKAMFTEAFASLNYVARYLPAAMCGNREGMRLDFFGSGEEIGFVAPYSEGGGSDLAIFRIYFRDPEIRLALRRVRSDDSCINPLDLPVSGSHLLSRGIKSIRFFYFDGNNWHNEWDTVLMEDPVLPAMIRIEVTALGKRIGRKESEEKFVRIINTTW